MPELPEVETVRRGLEPVLVDQRLVRVEQRRPDLRVPFPDDFVRRTDTRQPRILAAQDGIRRGLPGAVGDYVHASSTCRMGTVVDAEGSLLGYQGISVCDASVFPRIPDVNTHLPTTMLAERLCARWRRRTA